MSCPILCVWRVSGKISTVKYVSYLHLNVRTSECECLTNITNVVADSRRWGIFINGIRHTPSLWFNEAYGHTSLNHNEICHIQYENASRRPTGVRNLHKFSYGIRHISFWFKFDLMLTGLRLIVIHDQQQSLFLSKLP